MTRKLPGRTGTVTIDEAADFPSWFKPSLHRVEPRGIVLAATGDLLAEDGRPVNAAARAAWLETDTAEAAAVAAQPAAEQE